jgi:hypothetical protein
MTPMGGSRSTKSGAALQVLVKLCRSSVRTKDKQGRLPLHLVVAGHSSTSDSFALAKVRCLVEAYPRGLKERDARGQPPPCTRRSSTGRRWRWSNTSFARTPEPFTSATPKDSSPSTVRPPAAPLWRWCATSSSNARRAYGRR